MRQSGFTLAEILVALFVATMLVMGVTRLYQTVVGASVVMRSRNDDWGMEQFIRRQSLQALPGIGHLRMFLGEGDQMLFVSRHGAADGYSGKPVLAYYYYDPTRRALLYQEERLGAWWIKPQSSADPSKTAAGRLRGMAEPRIALRGLDSVEFLYFTGDFNSAVAWVSQWRIPEKSPSLVKLRYRRLGVVKELVLELSAPMAVPFEPT